MRLVLFLICLIVSNIAYAKETVNIFFPYAAGGTTDIIIRKIAAKLENDKYKFVVIPTPGAAGLVALNTMKNSKPNSLTIIGNGILTFNDVNFDQDLKFITFLGYEPTLIAVNSNSNFFSVEDLHKESKNRQITYGSSGVGSYGHYSSSIIANNNKNFTHVPFKSTGQAVPDLLAGRIDFLVMDENLFKRISPNNQLRSIATNYRERSKLHPTVKTLKEQGINNYDFYRWEIIISNTNIDSNLLEYLSKSFSNKQFFEDLESSNLILDFVNPRQFLNEQKNLMKQIENLFVK